MISKSLTAVLRQAGRLTQLGVLVVLGSLVALSTPVVALLLGAILNCLIAAEHGSNHFAALIPDPCGLLPAEWAPLAKVTALLAVALAVLVVTGLLLFLCYRQIQVAAVTFEVALIEKLRGHAKNLATVRTLSAQQQALTDCLDYHLPRVRASLSRWWRTFPRHFVQLAACVLVAVLIQPMLALLTLIATGLVVLLYRFLDRLRRTSLPVVRERAAQQRGTLIDLSLTGPLLATVHDEHEVERRFTEQLAHYRRDAVSSLTSSAWKTPTLVIAAGGLVSLFLFVIAVQVLSNDAHFTVAGAFSFFLCFVGGAVSAVRIQRTRRDLKTVETAAEELERFLALRVEEFDSEDLKTIDRVAEQAELDHVTVQDSRGRKLLENVSVVFKPGQLIGVVASQPLQAQALVELLMGLGRPVSGRMLVDGNSVTDLRPESLAQCAHWVASDGALVTGSVRDNLQGSAQRAANIDLNDLVHQARLTEVVQQLPDGLATIVTPGDDRLTADAPFRLGIARAGLRNASVVVVQEPDAHYDQQTEEQTLSAIQSLVKHSCITVVLPQRLLTLRRCDLIVMVHDHKVVDSGTHADLIKRNELYRHLNYLKYNAFRNA